MHQVRADQLVFWRGRESAIFVFLFPVLLYLLLSTVYSGEYRGRPNTDYLTSSLIAYGVANTAFGGLAIILVVRRELGILKRIRATPLPAPMYLAAALCSILLVFVLQATTIMVLGRLFYDWHLPEQWPSLFAAFLLGALCFAGMGFGAASLIRSAEGASAVVNVVILPMTFLSGGFGPTSGLPERSCRRSRTCCRSPTSWTSSRVSSTTGRRSGSSRRRWPCSSPGEWPEPSQLRGISAGSRGSVRGLPEPGTP